MPRTPEANRAAVKKHYEANKQYYLDKNKKATAARVEYLVELREKTPCMDCGKNFPYYIMDFDHREAKPEKRVTTLVGSSWKRMLEEIEKCDIVCANCHRVRTWQRRLASQPLGESQETPVT